MDVSNQDLWRFVNSFAPWLSAIGTISAVILSLYLARNDKQARLSVFADCRRVLFENECVKYVSNTRNFDAVVVHVTNTGYRTAIIDGIFWKMGIFKKRIALQNVIQNDVSGQIPFTIKEGEYVSFVFPISDEFNWIKLNGIGMLGKHPVIESFFIKIQIRITIGKVFEKRIGRELRRAIVAEKKKDECLNR